MDIKNENVVEEETVIKNKSVVHEKGKIVLSKPIFVAGAEVKEVRMDLESLTGKDILKMERIHVQENGTYLFDSFWNQSLLLMLASKASGILEDDLKQLNAKDFTAVTFEVRAFFLGH